MRNQEVAQRYARAIFQLSRQNKTEEKALQELREIETAVSSSEGFVRFFTVPVVTTQERKAVLEKIFEKNEVSGDVKGLLLRLVERGRFGLLSSIVQSFQAEVDKSHDIVRGVVRSAAPLWPEERTRLEKQISNYTGKKAVLEYHEEKSLLGGLVAQVGSLTFDDSLETQLRLIKEEIKRRAN